MTRYMNLNGDSGVAGYELGADSITVYFKDGAAYLYTWASAGASNTVHMTELAVGGRGLNRFISRVARKRYARKLR